MPNRYLGRDLANQRYLGRDVSSIRSFGRIIHEATTVVDNALDLFRAGVAAVDTISLTGLLGEGASGSLDTSVPVGTGTTSSNEDGTTPLANISRWEAGFGHTVVNTFLTNRTPVGSFVLLWVNDQNFALYEVDSHFLDVFLEIDIVSIESMVSVGTTGTGPATMYVFTDTAPFLRSVIEINGVWQPRDVVTLTGVYITTPSLTPAIAAPFTLTANLLPVGSNTPGPFTYQWFRNGVVTGTSVTSITNSISTAATSTYRVEVTDGDGAVFVSEDVVVSTTTHVPILATITYDATPGGQHYDAIASGGTGTLNYAWTFEIDGEKFRLDQRVDYTETGTNITNADRMVYDLNANFQIYNPTALFPNNTVSNIGLTISDDNHDEFFPMDTSLGLFTATANLNLNVLYSTNWKDAAGRGPITTRSTTPIGRPVLSWAYGYILADVTLLNVGTSGSPSEYGPYAWNGIPFVDVGNVVPPDVQVGEVTLNSIADFTGNSVALFRVNAFVTNADFSSFLGTTNDLTIAIPQVT